MDLDSVQPPLRRQLQEALARGDSLAVATVVKGPGAGNQLLVWSAGQAAGDLGRPRLNQRAALHAEQLFEKGRRPGRKTFQVQGQTVEVEFSFFPPAG